MGLGKLEECYKIVLESESDTKWKQVCARASVECVVECVVGVRVLIMCPQRAAW